MNELPLPSAVTDTVFFNAFLWLLAVHLPAMMAIALVCRPCRSAALLLAPWTPLPALTLVFTAAPGTAVHVPWMLFGARFGLDATGRMFLLFTALLWLIAGLYARVYHAHDTARERFIGHFLVTMTGNLGLILAADVVSFYLYFAVMSFASYGLIVHRGDEASRRAGRVYIVLVVVGEILLFAGLLILANAASTLELSRLAASLAPSMSTTLAATLLLAGFGIKAGALPLHVWLPLAHPAAPTAASAVLSGAMIKAGLLGWIRFLPIGQFAVPHLGWFCVVAGIVGAFFGVVVGVTQRNPKAALAYSSISQMGMMNVGVGAALIVPEAHSAALGGLGLYALHHALAKGSLFLGVGVAAAAGSRRLQRRLAIGGLLLPGIALAGAPLTSGAVAKSSLKRALALSEIPGYELIEILLSVAAIGTTLLIARFLFVVLPTEKGAAGHHSFVRLGVPWLLSILSVASVMWLLPWGGFDVPEQTARLDYVLLGLWPLLAGAAIAFIAWRIDRSGILMRWPEIPAGDLLLPFLRLLRAFHGIWKQLTSARWLQSKGWVFAHIQRIWDADDARRNSQALEERLSTWRTVGILFLALWILLFTLLAFR